MPFLRRYGPWALVTGASSGIGVEFARQLAKAGMHLVLTARRHANIEALAKELQGRHRIEVRCVAVDLSTLEGPTELISATRDLDIGLLVSNAGHVIPGSFLGHHAADYDGVIRLNVRTPMLLAHHFGRRMASRGRGGILFTSSIAGFGASPYMANYGGTKAYLISFGQALRHELARHGVDVAVLAPGPTDTPMATQTSALELPNMPLMNVTPVVAEALRRLPKTAIIVPSFTYKLAVFLTTRILSRRVATWLWGWSLSRTMTPRVLDPCLDSDTVPRGR